MTKSNKSTADELKSTRYQDYVIRDGQFFGKFEEMYRNAVEVPWHQDETVNAIFSDLTVALLKHRKVESLLDIGCGLGYMAERMRCEISSLKRVVGIDVSKTAIERARTMFPEIEFHVGTPQNYLSDETFQVVVSKDVLWYVLDDLAGYLTRLSMLSSNWVYIGQSFPEHRPFYGDYLLPDAEALFRFIDKAGYKLIYSVVERDANYGGREYAHAIFERS